MPSGSIVTGDTPLLRYVLERADDALVLGHRLSEWCGHGPMMEEDMALSNMGLDLLGQARALYAYAAVVEGAGRTEDDYAYLRDERAYGNLLLVEQPNGDFAVTMVRQFLYAAFMTPYWQAMTASTDATLAAIAAKAQKESAYHLRHAGEWVIRLGDGTDESHARARQALDALWPFTGECFMPSAAERALAPSGVVVDPATLAAAWRETVSRVIAEATLTLPADTWMQRGGRDGRHSEHLGHLLAELQHLQRSHPGATW
jgi:ring-1,2-phenylacetyl-CoA epoxidase subunit PaaC